MREREREIEREREYERGAPPPQGDGRINHHHRKEIGGITSNPKVETKAGGITTTPREEGRERDPHRKIV